MAPPGNLKLSHLYTPRWLVLEPWNMLHAAQRGAGELPPNPNLRKSPYSTAPRLCARRAEEVKVFL